MRLTLTRKDADEIRDIYTKMSPMVQWDIHLSREGDDTYSLRFEPLPSAKDGAVPQTVNACFALDRAARCEVSAYGEACDATVTLCTAGCGKASVTCDKHGTRRMPWQEAMQMATLCWYYGVMPREEHDRMIAERHAMRNGLSIDELDRVERWIEEIGAVENKHIA